MRIGLTDVCVSNITRCDSVMVTHFMWFICFHAHEFDFHLLQYFSNLLVFYLD
jgi:hypothetical protein